MATNNAINLSAAGVVSYNGNGVFTGSTLTQYDTLVGGASDAIVSVGPGTVGQVLTSNGSGANPSYQDIVIGGFPYTIITANQALVPNNGYFIGGAGISITLPTTSSVGDVIDIRGLNTGGGWTLTYTTGQSILFGESTTTVTTGNLTSILPSDSVRLICLVADLTWMVADPMNNILIDD
jgi:hypothetical protein